MSRCRTRRTPKFVELAVEFEVQQRAFLACAPRTSVLELQSGPEVLIAGMNAALASLRMGLYHTEEMARYVWGFLKPRSRDHMCMVLTALQFQMTATIQLCPQKKEIEPLIPTMKEIFGGDDKGPLAEGYLMPGKDPFWWYIIAASGHAFVSQAVIVAVSNRVEQTVSSPKGSQPSVLIPALLVQKVVRMFGVIIVERKGTSSHSAESPQVHVRQLSSTERVKRRHG